MRENMVREKEENKQISKEIRDETWGVVSVAEPLDDQGGPGPPKFLKKIIFFFENILKIL